MIYTSILHLSFLSIIHFCFTLRIGKNWPKVKINSIFVKPQIKTSPRWTGF